MKTLNTSNACEYDIPPCGLGREIVYDDIAKVLLSLARRYKGYVVTSQNFFMV